MTPLERAALIRLVIVAAAWALGEALVFAVGARGLGVVVPAILAAAAFMATRGMASPWRGGDQYWRGRPIDRDRWKH